MIMPVPSELLCDAITLLVPDGSGYSSVSIDSVRVVFRSKVSEYSSTITRDNSEITVYYDCTNSVPTDVKFAAGMLIEYENEYYEIIIVDVFRTYGPHHIRLKAKRV